MGFDAVTMSVFKNYADYENFIKMHRKFGHFVTKAEHVIIDLVGGVVKPFSFKYLTEKTGKTQKRCLFETISFLPL